MAEGGVGALDALLALLQAHAREIELHQCVRLVRAQARGRVLRIHSHSNTLVSLTV